MDFHFEWVNQPRLRRTGIHKTCYVPEMILPTSMTEIFLSLLFLTFAPHLCIHFRGSLCASLFGLEYMHMLLIFRWVLRVVHNQAEYIAFIASSALFTETELTLFNCTLC